MHTPPQEIGDIDLVWGKEGTGQSDGYGLAKLVKYHPEVLNNLQEILDDMHVVKRTANRIQLECDTHQATVRLTWNEQKKNWLLTAFEKKSSALDNTTDTAKTLSGKRNDTATPQNTAFISNNSKSSETKQEKAENLLKISRKVTESLWAKKALQTEDERRVIPELPTMEEQLKAMEEAKQMK